MEGSQKTTQEHRQPVRRGVRHGATVFDMERPDFYDGMWPEPDLSNGSLRNWLVKKQRFFVTGLMGKQGRVLDLGCGGGWRLFTCPGPVTGADISPNSLKGAATLYNNVTAADLSALPFATDSFDLVVSSDVIGHVPVEDKDRVIAEIYRVLKPGGLTFHYVETEGDDPLTRFAKSYPDLYRRHIIGPEGHEGLESPGETMSRFKKAGFQPVRELSAYKMLMYVNRVAQLYDNEYSRHSPLLMLAVSLSKMVCRFGIAEAAANAVLALVLEATDRLFPDSWGSGVMLEYRK